MKLPKFRNAIVYRATLPELEAIEGICLNSPTPEIGETEFHAPLCAKPDHWRIGHPNIRWVCHRAPP